VFKWHKEYLFYLFLLILNVDFVIVPFLQRHGFSGITLFLITVFFSLGELCGWFWFWSWFRRKAVPEIIAYQIARDQRIQEAIKLGKEVKKELEEKGLLERILEYFFRTFNKATDQNSKTFKKIKAGGHIAMFILGAEPWPGGRTIGVIFCGSTGWRRGLYTLMIGNIFHVAYVIGFWGLIFSLF